jgi:hypothetical protein
VTALDLNDLPIEPPKEGKRSSALTDFKLETMSLSPSKIGGSCSDHNGAALEEYNGEDQVSRWCR